MVLYQICEIGADRKFKMAARANYVFWFCPNFKNLLVRNYNVDWIDTLQKWLLGGPVLSLWIVCRSEIQNGRRDETKFNIGPYVNFTFSSSSLKPFNRFQPNFAEMLSRWCFIRFVKLVLIENSKWLHSASFWYHFCPGNYIPGERWQALRSL